ncbi:DUF3801 domain-containing protein [Paenibacillus naphthalenovorans]|uniref:PcfB family protein n=1 Tax=Paenibacillus naphthalenovorans TaxID=162209 RepID=UPI003D2AD92C
MSTETEAANQVVNMSLKSIEVMAKISGEGAKHLAVYLFAALQGQKRTKGSIRLESLLRSGKELKVFAVKNEDLATFCKEAKRYGVLYCALRDKKNVDGMCDVMVRAEDASKINRIVERFHLATVDTAKIKSEIEKSSGMSEAPAVEQGHEPGHEQVQEQELPKEIAEERNTDDLLDELMGKSELPELTPSEDDHSTAEKEPAETSHPSENTFERNEVTARDTDPPSRQEPERVSVRQLLREIREENRQQRKWEKDRQPREQAEPLPSRKERIAADKQQANKAKGRKRGKAK